MSANLTPQCFDFHGDQLTTCKDARTEKVYCLPREMAERLGLSWPAQTRKLQSSFYQQHTSRCVMATPSGEQEMVLLDVDMLPSWLMSISAEKVKPEVKEKLLSYQRECAKALRDYWTAGVAVNPRLAALDAYPELRAIVELAQSTAEARLAAKEAKVEAAEAKQDAARANAKADMAIDTQQFLTIAEYIYLNGLQRQMPTTLYAEYGFYLSDYCQKHGIPTRKIPVAYKRWEYEYGYHIGAIVQTLTGWLSRRYAQTELTVLPGGATL